MTTHILSHLRKSALILLLLLPLSLPTPAQEELPNAAELYRQALRRADKGNYRGAIDKLLPLYHANPRNLDYSYNLGVCYVNMQGNPDSALYYLGRVLRGGNYPDGSQTKLSLLMLEAKAYQLAGRPQDAQDTYDQVEQEDKGGSYTKLVARERRTCQNAAQLMQYPVESKFKSLGLPLNSSWDDFQPVGTAGEDTMFFTSRRPVPGEQPGVDGQYNDHLYYSVRKGSKWDGALWGPATPFDGISCQGDTSLNHSLTCIVRETGEAFLEINGDIWIARRDLDGNGWLPATRLPGEVNTPYYEGGAHSTADGRLLFFWSDAPGGHGGRDIYLSRRLPNDTWSPRLNLGPGVNTADNEMSPFYDEQQRILYFASDGEQSMGGYDIMLALANDSNQFVSSKNMGYPINSASHETMFLPSVDGDRALVVSGRCQSRADSPSLRIYEVEYEHPQSELMAVVGLQVSAPELHDVRIEVCQGGQSLGIIRPNAATGHAVMILETSNSYELHAVYPGVSAWHRFSLKGSDSYHVCHTTVELPTLDLRQAPKGGSRTPDALELTDQAMERWVFGPMNSTCGPDAHLLEPAGQLTAQADGANKNTAATQTASKESGPYVVQVFSLLAPVEEPRVKGLDAQTLTAHHCGRWYIYTSGSYDTWGEANRAALDVRKQTPYSDAFALNSDKLK